MKLIKDKFSSYRKIEGYSKEKVLDLKSKLNKISSKQEETDLDQFLNNLFPTEILESYSQYLLNIEEFISSYLIKGDQYAISTKYSYFHLKTDLIAEIDLISQNLLHLKRNIQNIQRFLRNNEYLRKYISDVADLMGIIERFIPSLKENTGDELIKYKSSSYIWAQMSKIKNSTFILSALPDNLNQWNEFSSFFSQMESKGEILEKKGLIKKEASEIRVSFNKVAIFCSNIESITNDTCFDLLYLLYSNELLTEESPTELLNEQDKENSKENVKDLLRSLFREAINDLFKETIESIQTIENKVKFPSSNDKRKPLDDILKVQKISDLLPELVDSYITTLELDYKNRLDISEYEDLEKIDRFIPQYSNNLETLYDNVENLTTIADSFKRFIDPYEYLIEIYEQVFSSVLSEIVRRKDELVYYLKTVRNEWVKEDLRTYIDEQIDKLDVIIADYRDEIAHFLQEEVPQMKNVETILKSSQDKIQAIKSKVSEKLDKYRGKDVKQYQFIKKWEETFTRRRQQLQFLLVQYFTKLMKEFGGLLEQENEFYRTLEDIKKERGTSKELPLNYLLSSYITEKLTQKELRERISNVKDKIAELKSLKNQYEAELTQLEEALTKKVKKIEDITTETVQCGVCHELIDFTANKIIKCPFCGAVYHYLCIAFWLQEYNSCPSCQNVFLDPNNNVYDPS